MEIAISVEALTGPVWQAIKDLANSQFGSSLLAAMAGAWGGAQAAQRIAEKGKLQDTLVQEIQNTNAAVELVAMVTGSYFNLKGQIVVPLVTEYEAVRTEAHRQYAIRQASPPGQTWPPIRLGMNMQTIGPMHVSFDRLEDIVLSKLSVVGRIRPLMVMMVQSAHSLDTTIGERNAMVLRARAEGTLSGENPAKMFGLPIASGIDLSFGQNVAALKSQTDDCIQFGLMLADDLKRHGAELRASYEKQFRGKVPAIVSLSWDEPAKRGLLPSAVEYDDWRSGFMRRVPATEGRRFGKVVFAFRRLARMLTFSKLASVLRPSNR